MERKDLKPPQPLCNVYNKDEADAVMDIMEARIKELEAKYDNAANAYIDGISKLLHRIEELEAKQPKWISVKDRMPEKHKRVLVYGWGFASKRYKVYFIKIAELRWNCTYGRAEFDCDGEVSHWMPLPEAPKE